jgi:type IV secretory pathway VirB2 component (pilin)
MKNWMKQVDFLKTNMLKQRILFFSCMFLVAQPTFAFSLFGNGNDVLSTALQNLAGYLSSTPAAAIGVLAIMGIGYAAIAMGKIPKHQAITIIIGIGVIYSAAFLMNKLFPSV